MTSPLVASFNQPPTQALDYFRGRGLSPTFGWSDLLHDEHAYAFSVAKMLDVGLLDTVRQALDTALSRGDTARDFIRDLTPVLQKAGWWGQQEVKDPWTGELKTVQLGSARRLELIYRVNTRVAAAAAQWARIQLNAKAFPYLRYVAVDDDRTRPQHAAWHNLILPVTSPFWQTHYPPNGWRCRCSVIPMTAAEVERRGGPSKEPEIEHYDWVNPRTGEIVSVPQGIDPGWGYNAGLARADELRRQLAERRIADLAARRAAALADIEKDIRSGDQETAVVVSTAGRELLRVTGSQDQVEFPAAKWPLLRNAIVTHNHPGGGGLSVDDMLTAAHYGISEIRAVDPDHTHSLSAPGQGWAGRVVEKLRAAYDSARASALGRLFDRLLRGQIAESDVPAALEHEAMAEFAEKEGLVYRREPKR